MGKGLGKKAWKQAFSSNQTTTSYKPPSSMLGQVNEDLIVDIQVEVGEEEVCEDTIQIIGFLMLLEGVAMLGC